MNKNVLLIILININFVSFLYAYHNSDSIPKKNNFHLNLGLSYIPLADYIGGPLIGISFSNPQKHLGLLVRTDYLLSIGKYSFVSDTLGTIVQSDNYEIVNYNNLFFCDIEYDFSIKKKTPIIAGLGYGWIYYNQKNISGAYFSYGYSVLSAKFVYKYSWISFEVRGNIPLNSSYLNKISNYYKLFPIQIGLIYRFAPRK
jgi:hypothetical protein